MRPYRLDERSSGSDGGSNGGINNRTTPISSKTNHKINKNLYDKLIYSVSEQMFAYTIAQSIYTLTLVIKNRFISIDSI